ncbi:hypothetical protein GCM10010451_64860 [Streptomyces virens]|uniref:Uncharacterized protein n=1 Tax=Streptomyces virens TaxID=285572 RepID=A0ABP6QB05_9ACTN
MLSVAAARLDGDEQLLNGRVYGTEHGNPNPGLHPHRTHAELVGGPLDGLLLDIHGWRTVEVDDGVALTAGSGGSPAAAPCTTRAPANPAHPARE